MKEFLLAIDQGTTSTRSILFDNKQNVVGIAQTPFNQIYPKEGWVEHDPMEIYATVSGTMNEVIAQSGVDISAIKAIGITNQRETTVVWERDTGRPIYNAIVWQCRRTADICKQLEQDGHREYIQKSTGLRIDAYFSGTKIKWILDNVEGAREKANAGKLCFGTIDTWLIYKLTNGKSFFTDYTNASRTMLFNLEGKKWDDKILDILGIPKSMLPQVLYSSDEYGETNIQGQLIPIAGVCGDQQSALFGQCCFNPGDMKNTYGTGCFVLMNAGEKKPESKNGLIATIGIALKDKFHYAAEGSIFNAGSVVQWLRDEMRFINESVDSEYFATKVDDTVGVYLVPAFTGLGAPYWDMFARGTLTGLTRGTKREHIIRAALESIVYQSHDVIKAMIQDTNLPVNSLQVDGGASSNNFLMQLQADILNTQVVRPKMLETTALGAACLAGLQVGVFGSLTEIEQNWQLDKIFTPQMDEVKRKALLNGWEKAVAQAMCHK